MLGRILDGVRVLIAFDAGAGVWAVRGLEYDVAAQGESVDLAEAAWLLTFRRQQYVNQQFGKEPLEGVPSAPPNLHAFWDGAEKA